MKEDNFDDIEIELSESVQNSSDGNGADIPPYNFSGENKGHNHKCGCRKNNVKKDFLNTPFGCVAGGFAGCVVIPLIVFVIVCISIGIACKNCGNSMNLNANEDYIALVRVEGVMTTGSADAGLFGGSGVSGSDTVSRIIRKAADDSRAKAVLIRVNSPGGTPAAAEEIGEAIEYAKGKKPVYASVADSGCSAAYWISSLTDKIYVNRTSMTGSIGVIMNGIDYSKLLDKVGVSSQTLKSGKFKDIGSGSRPMTPEEKQILQAVINDTYDAFLDTVAKGRKMPKEKVKALADGRIYTGSQAVKNGLADKIGTYDTAVSDIANKAGMKKATVKDLSKNSFIDQLMMPEMKKTLDLYLINELKKSVSENQLEMR